MATLIPEIKDLMGLVMVMKRVMMVRQVTQEKKVRSRPKLEQVSKVVMQDLNLLELRQEAINFWLKADRADKVELADKVDKAARVQMVERAEQVLIVNAR